MTGPDFTKHPQQPQPPQQPQYGQQPGPQQPYGYQGGYQPGGYPPPPGYPPAYPPPGYPPAGYGYPPMAVNKHTGWFVVNWIFLWPLAIYSLVAHWTNIDRDLYFGNVAGAQRHAAAVRKCGIIALCISVGLLVLYLILAITLFATVAHTCITTAGSNSC
jgi:hypothetical protein